MPKPPDAIHVLLIEDDPDTGEMLALALGSRGVHVQLVTSGTQAMASLAATAPDVIVCDLSLPDGSGLDWLAKFRSIPGIAVKPAIALSGHASPVDRERSLDAGFEKHLGKSAMLADIIASITHLSRPDTPQALHRMLSRLSTKTGCQFTSLLRFDNGSLVSVWTFDRNQPAIDPFPINLPIIASYCVLVRDARALVAIENAPDDPRADGHPKQHQLATYVGAPVFKADGAMYGTLCSYDPAPLAIDASARIELLAAARQVEATLPQNAAG